MTTRGYWKKTVVPAGLLALLASFSAAFAGQDLRVRVPFDFLAGQTHFGPGEYVVAMDEAPVGSVKIRSTGHGRSAVVHPRKASGAGAGTTPSVSFRAYGDSRFLSAIQLEGGDRWEIAPSADEATLKRTHGQPTVTSLKAESVETK